MACKTSLLRLPGTIDFLNLCILSKIEAGRMDVNPEPFDMKALVTYCCATVSPLLEEKPDVKLEQDVADGIEKAAEITRDLELQRAEAG
jgi:hypothetical protein